MVLKSQLRAVIVCVALAGAFILAEGSAQARATSENTWGKKIKTFKQFIQLCKRTPDIPMCRRASFYFGKLSKRGKYSGAKRFTATVKQHLSMQKARRQKLKQMERRENNQRNYWRRMWKRARFRMLALKRSWFGRGRQAAAVAAAGPFNNTAGFGHYVSRANKQVRNSWVYKRGRLGVSSKVSKRIKASRLAAKKKEKERKAREKKRKEKLRQLQLKRKRLLELQRRKQQQLEQQRLQQQKRKPKPRPQPQHQ